MRGPAATGQRKRCRLLELLSIQDLRGIEGVKYTGFFTIL